MNTSMLGPLGFSMGVLFYLAIMHIGVYLPIRQICSW